MISHTEPASVCNDPSCGALLLAYSLGTLSSDEATRFEEHLLSCVACQTEIEASEETLKRLAISRIDILSKLRRQGIGFGGVFEGAQAKHSQPSRAKRYVAVGAMTALAVAAVLVLLVWQRASNPASDGHQAPEVVDHLQTGSTPATTDSLKNSPTSAQQSDSLRLASARRAALANLATKQKLPFAAIITRGSRDSLDVLFAETMKLYEADSLVAARTALLKLRTIAPKHSDIWLYLGITAYLSGAPDLAKSSFEQGLKLHPEHKREQQLNWYLANVYLHHGNGTAALPLLRAVAGEWADSTLQQQSRAVLPKVEAALRDSG